MDSGISFLFNSLVTNGHLSYSYLPHLYLPLTECPLFDSFIIVFFFFLLSFKHSLYISDRVPLSDM